MERALAGIQQRTNTVSQHWDGAVLALIVGVIAMVPSHMTKRELLAAERKRIADMDRRAAADFEQMDRANSKPIDLALLEAERWTGGGFTWNGQLVGRSRP